MTAEDINSFPFCACGCGEHILPFNRNRYERGQLKGEFPKYRHGHHKRRCYVHRELSALYKVNEHTGCWVWQGYIDPSGYGRLSFYGDKFMAHVLFYIAFGGSIPTGYEVDHLCRNRACVNPAHLEAVTHSENVCRGAICHPEFRTKDWAIGCAQRAAMAVLAQYRNDWVLPSVLSAAGVDNPRAALTGLIKRGWVAEQRINPTGCWHKYMLTDLGASKLYLLEQAA